MPRFEKYRGKIIKVIYSKEEQRAMDQSIRDQLVEYDKEHAKDIESIVLDILHDESGFGAVRAERVFEKLHPRLLELFNRYGAGQTDEDKERLAKLQKLGIDIGRWSVQYEGEGGEKS
jgi:hypothetical protein